MNEAISHITLIVKDINKTANLLKLIFHAEEVYSSGQKNFSLSPEKYFLIKNQWFVIMEGESLQQRTYDHIAFSVSEEEFSMYESRVKKLGLEIKPARNRIEGEGKSLYFYDYDNHLFEIHSGSLSERLYHYSKKEGKNN